MEREKLLQNEKERTEKLFNFRPVLFSAVCLCLGVLFVYLHYLIGLSLWWFCSLPVLGVIIFFITYKRTGVKRVLIALLLLACSFALGAGAFALQIYDFQSVQSYEGEQTVIGRVIELTQTDKGTRVLLDGVYIGQNRENGTLVAYLPASYAQMLNLSDEIIFHTDIYTKTDIFGQYGVNVAALRERTRRYTYAGECVVTGHAPDLFLDVRQRIKDVLEAGMDETPAAVTMAVLLGDTGGMDEGLLDNIRRGGIAHIFAVSGLHIGALYAFCLLLVNKTGLSRTPKIVRFLLVTAVLFFYGGVCGFSASVLRAIVICLTSYVFLLIGLKYDSLEALGFAIVINILLAPCTLFSVGFLLSFAACFGIALLARPLAGLIRIEKGRDSQGNTHPLTLWQSVAKACVNFVAVTLSAQLATTPILLAYFGYVSGFSLLLNGLFVPILSAIFPFLLLVVAVAFLLPITVSAYILFLPNAVWSALLLLFQSVDFSAFCIENIKLTVAAVFCYYVGLLFCTDKWNISKSHKIVLAAVYFTASALCVAFG